MCDTIFSKLSIIQKQILKDICNFNTIFFKKEGITITSLFLKIIALISMTIDHVGALLFNNNIYCRLLGRLAFPIYAFLLVEGFEHTKNDKNKFNKYLLRLLIWAIISEIPFNFFIIRNLNYLPAQNVIFTLFLGLVMLYVLNKYSNYTSLQIIYIVCFSLTAIAFRVDYSIWGILCILLFYFYKKNHSNIFLAIGMISFFIVKTMFDIFIYKDTSITYNVLLNLTTCFALIPITLYNGKLGYNNKLLKTLFYAYYPLHLIIITTIYQIIMH